MTTVDFIHAITLITFLMQPSTKLLGAVSLLLVYLRLQVPWL